MTKSYSQAQISMFAFSIYMFFQGLLLMTFPNILFQILGMEATFEVWVRFVGVALWIFSLYYFLSARENLKTFFQFTVWGRILQFILIVVIVLVGHFPLILIGFSFVEFLSGVWTHFALQGKK